MPFFHIDSIVGDSIGLRSSAIIYYFTIKYTVSEEEGTGNENLDWDSDTKRASDSGDKQNVLENRQSMASCQNSPVVQEMGDEGRWHVLQKRTNDFLELNGYVSKLCSVRLNHEQLTADFSLEMRASELLNFLSKVCIEARVNADVALVLSRFMDANDGRKDQKDIFQKQSLKSPQNETWRNTLTMKIQSPTHRDAQGAMIPTQPILSASKNVTLTALSTSPLKSTALQQPELNLLQLPVHLPQARPRKFSLIGLLEDVQIEISADSKFKPEKLPLTPPVMMGKQNDSFGISHFSTTPSPNVKPSGSLKVYSDSTLPVHSESYLNSPPSSAPPLSQVAQSAPPVHRLSLCSLTSMKNEEKLGVSKSIAGVSSPTFEVLPGLDELTKAQTLPNASQYSSAESSAIQQHHNASMTSSQLNLENLVSNHGSTEQSPFVYSKRSSNFRAQSADFIGLKVATSNSNSGADSFRLNLLDTIRSPLLSPNIPPPLAHFDTNLSPPYSNTVGVHSPECSNVSQGFTSPPEKWKPTDVLVHGSPINPIMPARNSGSKISTMYSTPVNPSQRTLRSVRSRANTLDSSMSWEPAAPVVASSDTAPRFFRTDTSSESQNFKNRLDLQALSKELNRMLPLLQSRKEALDLSALVRQRPLSISWSRAETDEKLSEKDGEDRAGNQKKTHVTPKLVSSSTLKNLDAKKISSSSQPNDNSSSFDPIDSSQMDDGEISKLNDFAVSRGRSSRLADLRDRTVSVNISFLQNCTPNLVKDALRASADIQLKGPSFEPKVLLSPRLSTVSVTLSQSVDMTRVGLVQEQSLTPNLPPLSDDQIKRKPSVHSLPKVPMELEQRITRRFSQRSNELQMYGIGDLSADKVASNWLKSLTTHFDSQPAAERGTRPTPNIAGSFTTLLLSRSHFSSIDFLVIYLGLLINGVAESGSLSLLKAALLKVKNNNFGANILYGQAKRAERVSVDFRAETRKAEPVQVPVFLAEPSEEAPDHPWLIEILSILDLPQDDKAQKEARMIKLMYYLCCSLYDEKLLVRMECICGNLCPVFLVSLLWPVKAFQTFENVLNDSKSIFSKRARSVLQSCVLLIVYRLMAFRSRALGCARYEILDVPVAMNSSVSFLSLCSVVIDEGVQIASPLFNTLVALMLGKFNSYLPNMNPSKEIVAVLSAPSFLPIDFFSSKIFHSTMLYNVMQSACSLPLPDRVNFIKMLNLFALRGHGNCDILLALPSGWEKCVFALLHDISVSPDKQGHDFVALCVNLFVVIFYDILMRWTNIFNMLEIFFNQIIEYASWNQSSARFVRYFLASLLQVVQKRSSEIHGFTNGAGWGNVLRLLGVMHQFVFFSASNEWVDTEPLRSAQFLPRIAVEKDSFGYMKTRAITSKKIESFSLAAVSLPDFSQSYKRQSLSRSFVKATATTVPLTTWSTNFQGALEMRLDDDGNFADSHILAFAYKLLVALKVDSEYSESLYLSADKYQLRKLKSLHGYCAFVRRVVEILAKHHTKQELVVAIDDACADKKIQRSIERLLQECQASLSVEANLIFEGNYMCSSSRGEDRYSFFLTNKRLHFCKGSTPDRPISAMEFLSFGDLHVNTESLSHLGYPHAFGLTTVDLSFLVNCTSNAECEKWKKHLLDAIYNSESSVENNIYQNYKWGDGAFKCVYWVPSSYSDACQGCKSVFSIFLRKHHCRHCGLLFCDSCTSYRWQLNLLDPVKPSRVCKSCLDSLTVQRDEKAKKLSMLHANRLDAQKLAANRAINEKSESSQNYLNEYSRKGVE